MNQGWHRRQDHTPAWREADIFLHKWHLEQQRLVGIVVDTHLIDAPNVDDHALAACTSARNVGINLSPSWKPSATAEVTLLAAGMVRDRRASKMARDWQRGCQLGCRASSRVPGPVSRQSGRQSAHRVLFPDGI